MHCTAFRRLVYKTQVFLNHEGDLFRTRLTHSLEVAQLARSMARALALNEDLVEAIALAHDLGHTPFGHAGQDALHDCMRADHGGFEHNLQSLRVVDSLEQRYPALRRTEPDVSRRARASSSTARAAMPSGSSATSRAAWHSASCDGTQPSWKRSWCNLADEMAYNAHDIDDGVRSGLLGAEQLLRAAAVQALPRRSVDGPPGAGAGQPAPRLLSDAIARMLRRPGRRSGRQRAPGSCRQLAPADADAARGAPPLLGFSAPMRQAITELKRFLFGALYRHAQVRQSTGRARQVVADLFAAYVQSPREMPAEHAESAAKPQRERAVADYIAGMTDRFALREHQRLTGLTLFG